MRIDQVQKLCEQWHLSSQLSAGSELNSIACTTIKYTKPYPWRDTPSFTTYRFQQWPRTAGERYKFFSIYLFIFFCSIFFFPLRRTQTHTQYSYTHTHTHCGLYYINYDVAIVLYGKIRPRRPTGERPCARRDDANISEMQLNFTFRYPCNGS